MLPAPKSANPLAFATHPSKVEFPAGTYSVFGGVSEARKDSDALVMDESIEFDASKLQKRRRHHA
jgi:hypothetical protein